MSNSPDRTPQPAATSVLLRHTQALSGLKAYEAAIDDLIAMAIGRVRIFDRLLGRAYNAAPRIDLLRTFLLANGTNRIAIVVHEVERIRTDCPRLVALQRQFCHAISIDRTQAPARGVYDPFCVIDGSHYARRFHFDSLRGLVARNDADGAGELVQRFSEIQHASRPAVTGTTLGL